jgi:outer membrane receptor for ferrienterochelin and colicins
MHTIKYCARKTAIFFAAVLLIAESLCFAKDSEANAQKNLFDMSLEELSEQTYTVKGASKYEQKTSEAPASVTIITSDEIRKYGYKTLAGVLDSVPGLFITYDRNYHYIGVRGFRRPGDFDSRILILINGHRINENIYDSVSTGTTFPVDIDLIEKVEVIKGPGSSLYGSNTFLAVVNVITKDGKTLKGTEVSGEAGSYETYKGRVSYGRDFNENYNLLVSATTFDSDGPELHFKEFDDPAANNGNVSHDGDKFYNLFCTATAGEFSFLATYVPRDKQVPTAPWGTVFTDSHTKAEDDMAIVGMEYKHDFTDDLAVRGRASYHHYNYDGAWEYDDGGRYINRDTARGRWWESELQFIAKPLENHKLTWGIEDRYNARQDQQNWDSDVYLDDQRTSNNWGVYIQDEWKIFEKWIFVGGVRHDEYDSFGGTTNPRLAIIYQHSDATTLKLLYGRAFRAPNVYELYYNDGDNTMKAAGSLDPETIDTYEAVLEQKLNKNLSTTTSVFHYKIDDVIDTYLDPSDGLSVFRNLNEVTANGIETALLGRWENGAKGRASYTFVEARDGETDAILVSSPKQLAKFNIIYPLMEKNLFAGIEVLYASKMKTLTGNYTEDSWITNLTLTYENIVKGLEISASVYNLFDVDYGHPGGAEHTEDIIYQDGTTYRIKLTYRF